MAPPSKKRVQSSVKKESSPSSSSKKQKSAKTLALALTVAAEEQVSKKRASASSDSPTRKLFDHRFVKQDCFFSKAHKLRLEIVSSVAHTFAEPEKEEEAFTVPPEDTSKFRLMRNDYTAVPILFRSPSRPSLEWKSWVSSELENLGSKDQLRRAGVLSALMSSTQLGIFRDIRGIRHLVRRWNKTTHTFVCSWGEFTPTLEDVSKLLKLPVMGDSSPFGIALTEKEAKIEATLLEGLTLCRLMENKKQSSRPSFACWIRYFWGTMEKEKFQPGAGYESGCRLEALVCLWLCKFVFPELQGDVIQRHMFPLSVKIAHGVRFPLAPVFLGTFYKHLDMILEDEIIAGGKYAIDTELGINFLQVFLWERIKKYAGDPTPSKAVAYEIGTNSDVPLWSRWFHLKHTRSSIWLYIDDIDNITFRPYVALENEFSSGKKSSTTTTTTTTSEILKVPMCDSNGNWADLEYVVSIRPGLLPACIGCEIFSVNYWPHRVLRQFGLDQGVPRLYSFSDEDVLKSPSFGVSRFISSSLKSLPTIKSLTIQIAGNDRQGLYTPKFVSFWKRTIGEFSRFVKSPKSICVALPPSLVPKRLRLDTREVRSFCTKIGMPFTVIDGAEREVVGAIRTGRREGNKEEEEEDLPLAEMLSKISPVEEKNNEEPNSMNQETPSEAPAKRRHSIKHKSGTPKRKSARLLLKSLSSDDMETNEDGGGLDETEKVSEESHFEETNNNNSNGLGGSKEDGGTDELGIVENGKESDSEEEELKKLKSEPENYSGTIVAVPIKNNHKRRRSLPLAMVACPNNNNNNYNNNNNNISPVDEPQSELPLPKKPRDDKSNGSQAAAAAPEEADGCWQSNLNEFLGKFYGNAVAPRSIEDFVKLSGRTRPMNGIPVPEEAHAWVARAMEAHGDFVANCWASRPVRDIMFSRLSLVLLTLERVPLSQLSEDMVLALRDVVREATAVGFGVDFLLDHMRKLVSALFGRRIYFDRLTAIDAQIEAAQAELDSARARLEGLKRSRAEVVLKAGVSTGKEGDCIRQALEFSTSLVHGL